MRGELPRQLVEQFRVARRAVRVAQPVDRLDQARAEEMMPDAVDGGAGEPGILGPGDPLGEQGPRSDRGPVRPAAIEEARLRPRCSVLPILIRAGAGPGPRPGSGRSASFAASAEPASGPAKNAANSQNCCRFHEPPRRSLWHWTHSSLTPRKSRVVRAARLSGFRSLATKKASAPGSVKTAADEPVVGRIRLDLRGQPALQRADDRGLGRGCSRAASGARRS